MVLAVRCEGSARSKAGLVTQTQQEQPRDRVAVTVYSSRKKERGI